MTGHNMTTSHISKTVNDKTQFAKSIYNTQNSKTDAEDTTTMSCLPAILLIIGVCSLLSYNCKLLLCTATVCLQHHNPWSQVIKSYSPQHASPAKMLPSLAKDFYLPPQHGHGTSVMLSIFCSVLLCFMGLCKGSRLTGWADLDSQPVGACAAHGVTSRALANQGQDCVASSAPTDTQEDIMFHTCSAVIYKE